MDKLIKAARKTQIKDIAIAGGVSANSGLKTALTKQAAKDNWKVHIPKLGYSLDNAAMIAMTGYFKFLKGDFVNQGVSAQARGNSQLIVVKDHLEMEIIGQTIDDAAGEAFDKCAKLMDIPYPGGPVIDKYAQ
ncbi:unnamed protein product, partial [Cyprideis torosa]